MMIHLTLDKQKSSGRMVGNRAVGTRVAGMAAATPKRFTYVCHTNIWDRFKRFTIDCHTNISDLLTALGKTYFRDPDLREKLLFNCLLRLPPASLTVVMCISTLKKCLHRVYFIVQKYAYLIRGKYTLIIRISIYTYQQKYPCLCKYIQLNRKWI